MRRNLCALETALNLFHKLILDLLQILGASLGSLRLCLLRAWVFFLCFFTVLITSTYAEEVLDQPVDKILQRRVGQPRTISRTEDFVVVRGSKLTCNLHRDIKKMSLFALIDGEIQPIPFQIDEINKKGEWILPQSPPYLKEKGKKIDRDDDQGLLDENDELVFMIRDSGDRIEKKFYPDRALYIDEIMMTDPQDNGRAWVYLCFFAKSPPRSEENYVNYIFPDNHIVSPNYELGFSLKVPISWDYLSFPGGPNLFDRMKLRVNIRFFSMDFYFDETNFRSELSHYKDGPIRVIRRVRSAIYLNKILRTPSLDSESIYYDNAIAIPFRIKIPISLPMFGKHLSIKMYGTADMQNLHGWQVKNRVDPRWLKIDGKMDELEKEVNREGANWYILSGPRQCILKRIVFNRNPDGTIQKLPIQTDMFYIDDDNSLDPPEFVPGQSPNIGFWEKGLNKLKKGIFYFYMIDHMISQPYRAGLEDEYLRIVDEPVEVSVE